MKRLAVILLVLLTVSWAVTGMAKAKRYSVDLNVPIEVGGTQLKPGVYDYTVEDGTVIFYRGPKEVARAAARTEKNDSKYVSTSVVYSAEGGALKEIRVGGSATKVIVEAGTVAKAPSRNTSGTVRNQ